MPRLVSLRRCHGARQARAVCSQDVRPGGELRLSPPPRCHEPPRGLPGDLDTLKGAIHLERRQAPARHRVASTNSPAMDNRPAKVATTVPPQRQKMSRPPRRYIFVSQVRHENVHCLRQTCPEPVRLLTQQRRASTASMSLQPDRSCAARPTRPRKPVSRGIRAMGPRLPVVGMGQARGSQPGRYSRCQSSRAGRLSRTWPVRGSGWRV
jgi:hypothetical protein